MQLLKLTILSSLLFAVAIGFTSCEKEADRKKVTEYSRTAIAMTGAQENNPLNTSPAIGSMDVFYSKASKTLVYKVTWSGLTDSVMLMHIHGLAPVGFNTSVVQNIIVPATPNGTIGLGIFPQKTAAGKYNFYQSGTISGSLLVDGVVIKEENLLNGLYYMNIHTTTYPAGEIRGQIKFQ
jgi:CHRD domain